MGLYGNKVGVKGSWVVYQIGPSESNRCCPFYVSCTLFISNALICIDDNINFIFLNYFFRFFFSDDIRELNGHANQDEEIKRQRLHYGSDQLYSVSISLPVICFCAFLLFSRYNSN